MSSGGGGGTAAASPPEPQAFKRAARKIKCAAMVANLAKSWQGWAAERSEQQDAIPSGWMPESGEENGEKTPEVKLPAAPRVIAADPANANANAAAGTRIRTGAVNKSVQPRLSERGGGGGDVFNAIRGKMESGPLAAESKPFLGNESPTRRRQMRALQGKPPGARSGGVDDTEDGGPGQEAGLGDGGEAKTEAGEIKTPRRADRPKVKVSTGSDVKRRWQQWSVQHMAGQRLNPFSEDFDHDFAMAQRLRKGDDGYGRPKDGSKTAERGDRAQKHVHREMEEMVWIIRDMGLKDKEGRTAISFGRLFDRYVKISDKVVGIALRCRKHKMLDFQGEMLWKGQDDHVIITLTD